MKLHIHFGPGNHEPLLESALHSNQIDYSFTKYWPTYQQGEVKNQYKTIQKEGGSYDKLSYLMYAIWHRLPFLNKTQGHLDLLYRYYDSLAASGLPKEVDVLLAWSQVGLYTMQKAKKQGATVILEHPMVHVNTWMDLMKEEFKNNAQGKGVKYSLFTKSMVKRMLQEYETADYINVISTYSKQTFIDNGVPESKLVLTPLGIDTDYFKPLQSIDKNEHENFKVLFVGRLELLKGVHYLLEAFAEINLINIELLLAGRLLPEMQPFLDKYKGRFTYVGTKNQEELKALYQNVDLLVLPSVQESFGLVLAEAMACGVPVISTTNTGGPDLIQEGENGFIVPIRNMKAIKQKIEWFYNNRHNLESFKQQARKKILDNFALGNYSQNIKMMFERTFHSKQID